MRILILVLLATFSSPAMAEDYVRVTDRGAFLALVSGKKLTSLAVTLTVSPSGSIGGRAFGRDVTGSWTWSNSYFCRTLKAGDKTFSRNCQVVKRKGNRLRFIADQGAGQTADLRIR
jgi:ribosomal protein L36